MTHVLKNLANKRQVSSALNLIAESNLSSIGGSLAKAYHADAQWRGYQLPFRPAFAHKPNQPQPPGMAQHGSSHYVRIGDGRYSATGGWPSRHMMHQGGGWLGLGASGRPTMMRVMDFYRADQGMIRENWVPIDLLNVLLQLEVDVLARVRKHFGAKRFA